MIIGLSNNFSEKNVIEKYISTPYEIEGSLKNNTSITDPIILIEATYPITHNYCYIPTFLRYYFIVDIVNIRNNLWELKCHVDVLMSFKNDIKNSVGIMKNTENENNSRYFDNGIYKTLVKDKTDIISFANGFLDSGEYILITAGGDS